MKLFACLVVGIGLIGLIGAQKHPKPPDSKVRDLSRNLAKIRDKKTAVQKQLRETKKQVRIVKGDIKDVDYRLGTLEVELDKTQTDLVSSRAEQRRLAGELKTATEKLAAKRVQVKRRLREMYIIGDASVTGVLAGAKTVGDVASRRYLIERIAERDRVLFDEVESLQAAVNYRKQRQDGVVRRISGLVQTQKQQQDSLEDTRQDKAALLGQLRGKQAELEKMARQFDQDESSIEAQIAAYQRGPGRNNGLRRPTGRLGRPVPGGVGSGFGMRFHPILKRNRMHKGLDFHASSGSSIACAADGIVISATYMRGFGNCLIVDHGGGLSTLYAHCSRLLVGSGARVSRGQRIGLVGSTGLSTGPHLHFEVHVNGKAVNPMGYL